MLLAFNSFKKTQTTFFYTSGFTKAQRKQLKLFAKSLSTPKMKLGYQKLSLLATQIQVSGVVTIPTNMNASFNYFCVHLNHLPT